VLSGAPSLTSLTPGLGIEAGEDPFALAEALPVERLPETSVSARLSGALRNHATFAAVWAVQSRLASITLLSLVALSHPWLGLGIMAAWSLIATVLYFVARLHGAPDLFELGMSSSARRTVASSLTGAFLWVFRIVLVGPPAFIYTKLLRLAAPGKCVRRRFCHAAVLAAGATLFGVTTTHHILRKGGFEGRGLLKLSCAGSLLNVSYRTALSAMFLAGLSYVAGFTGLV
jgi:hypothetical protein